MSALGRTLRIGLMVGTQDPFGIAMAFAARELGGVAPHWRFSVIKTGRAGFDHLPQRPVDALIIRPTAPDDSFDQLARLEALGLPWVMITGADNQPRPSTGACFDNRAIGHLAAEHLIGLGHRQVAVVRWRPDRPIWLDRTQGFVEAMRAAGGTVAVQALEDEDEIRHWLATASPRPTAVFGVNDSLAERVLTAAERLVIGIPAELSVVGVDNDPHICTFTEPPLTSVIPDFAGVLTAAVSLLARRLDGQQVPGRLSPVLPIGLAVRDSSGPVGGDDDLTRVFATIRAHACHDLGVAELAQHTGLSVRAVQRLCAARLGRNPLQVIRSVRLDHAKELLADRRLSVAQVAERCGYPSPQRFSTVFHEMVGCSPSAWRNRGAP